MRLSELNDLYVKFFGKILLSERAARGQCASSLIAFLSSKIYLHSSTKLFSRLYFNNPCSDVRQPIIFYEYNLHREWTRRLGGVTKLKGNIMSFHRRHFRLTVTFMQMSFFHVVVKPMVFYVLEVQIKVHIWTTLYKRGLNYGISIVFYCRV